MYKTKIYTIEDDYTIENESKLKVSESDSLVGLEDEEGNQVFVVSINVLQAIRLNTEKENDAMELSTIDGKTTYEKVGGEWKGNVISKPFDNKENKDVTINLGIDMEEKVIKDISKKLQNTLANRAMSR